MIDATPSRIIQLLTLGNNAGGRRECPGAKGVTRQAFGHLVDVKSTQATSLMIPSTGFDIAFSTWLSHSFGLALALLSVMPLTETFCVDHVCAGVKDADIHLVILQHLQNQRVVNYCFHRDGAQEATRHARRVPIEERSTAAKSHRRHVLVRGPATEQHPGSP